MPLVDQLEHALPGEGVDAGGGYFGTVAAQIGPAHVVGQDEDNVGTAGVAGLQGSKGYCQVGDKPD